VDNRLDENARMFVEVSNLRATDADLEKFVTLLIERLGSNITYPETSLIQIDSEGAINEVQFTVKNPDKFKPETVEGLLESLALVGWRIDSTFVR